MADIIKKPNKNIIDFSSKEQNQSSTTLSLDDVGTFPEEVTRVTSKIQELYTTKLRVDYSDFSNHVFFDSALSKFQIAQERVLNQYPYNGSTEEKDQYAFSGSGYELNVLDNWPSYVGYLNLSSNQYISASDSDNKLRLSTSSLYVSAWVNPLNISKNAIVQVLSSSGANKNGYQLYFTSSFLKFDIFSGTSTYSVSCSYGSLSGTWHNVATIYDSAAQQLYLYVDTSLQQNVATSLNSIEFAPIKAYIGSGSGFASYSGSIDEVRILHTSSIVYHLKNYNRQIDSNDYVKLYYKFNEGVVGTSSIDQNIADYSKSSLNGVITNYTSTVRVSGSPLSQDPGDPILYSYHPDVVQFTSSQVLSASLFDKQNRNIIFRLVPQNLLIEDDNAQGLLQSFLLTIARFFDDKKLYVDQFSNLRVTNYSGYNETPDVFLTFLKEYFGFKTTQHFDVSSPLEFIFGENISNTSPNLQVSPIDIRHEFWRRILNNLPYIYKSKGKRAGIDAFFNVLGIDKNVLNFKEFGYLPGGSIQDDRITKQKTTYFLDFFTDGISSASYVAPANTGSGLFTQIPSNMVVEVMTQLPHASSSYSASLTQGSLWFISNPNGSTKLNFSWNTGVVNSESGSFTLSSSDGQSFTTPYQSVFDGRTAFVAAGFNGSVPFVQVRSIDNDSLNFSSSYTGSVAFSGALFTGSNTLNFFVGSPATLPGGFTNYYSQGEIGQARVWSGSLSSSELDAHALDFQNIGTIDPIFERNKLILYWGLNENLSASSTGKIGPIPDLSQNGYIASGSLFSQSSNPYTEKLLTYNFISPNLDLKWTGNKVRVRNLSKIRLDQAAIDSNEVTLEFNLVDSLNEDITKIFSTMADINNAIGVPINKYRDEYSDLESLRTVYFKRLTTSLNFNKFFDLFTWFDKKIGQAIKQLLPARTNFVGGEFVVESHLLERPKYQYRYPLFKTPKEIQVGAISGTRGFDASLQTFITQSTSTPAMSSYVYDKYQKQIKYATSGTRKTRVAVTPRYSTVFIEGDLIRGPSSVFKNEFLDGDEIIDRNIANFSRIKVSGDTATSRNTSRTAINFKNERAKKILNTYDKANLDGFRTGSFIDSRLGGVFISKALRTSVDNQHYLAGNKKHIQLSMYAQGPISQSLTGTLMFTSSMVALTGGNAGALSRSAVFASQLGDTNKVLYDTTFFLQNFGISSSQIDTKHGAKIVFRASASNQQFDMSALTMSFKDGNSSAWTNFRRFDNLGMYVSESNGWFRFETRLLSGGAIQRPTFALSPNNVYFSASLGTGNAVYYIKDLQLQFEQPLTNDGVLTYQSLENQKTPTSYVNRKVLVPVLSSQLLSFSYYDWKILSQDYIKVTGSSVSNVLFNSIAKDSLNNLYAVGEIDDVNNNSIFWVVLKSTNNGATWITSDIVSSSLGSAPTDNGTLNFEPRAAAFDVVVDNSDAIHVVGQLVPNTASALTSYSVIPTEGVIRSSYDRGKTWKTIFATSSFVSAGAAGNCVITCIDKDINGNLYCGVYSQGQPNATPALPDRISIFKSSTGQSGSWTRIVHVSGVIASSQNAILTINSLKTSNQYAEKFYFTGLSGTNSVNSFFDNTGLNGYVSWYTSSMGSITSIDPTVKENSANVNGLSVSKQDYVAFVVEGGHVGTSRTASIGILSGTGPLGLSIYGSASIVFNTTGSFSANTIANSDTLPFDRTNGFTPVTFDTKDNILISYLSLNDGDIKIEKLHKNDNGTFSSVTPIDSFAPGNVPFTSTKNLLNIKAFQDDSSKNDQIFIVAENSTIIRGRLTSNSSSIGQTMLATSVQYTYAEFSGTTYKNRTLLNISEYPHSEGIFQMKNIVLGTSVKGTQGKSSNSLVQVKHIGSFVQVMWPAQDNLANVSSNVRESLGQLVGKLDTSFTPGDKVNCEEFDHVSLYCTILKQASGTLDDIVIRVERKPLTNLGYSTDQAVEYTTSGSYVEARLRDIEYKKQIDYGDLTLFEISWPIDIPLTNVKELRISAKQANGQTLDSNKNLIVYGRFIKRDKNISET